MRLALLALLLSGCATQEFGTCHTVRLGLVTGEPGFADECTILPDVPREPFRHMNPQTYRSL